MLEEPATFGSRLREARLAAGMTLVGLANAIHYSKSQLSKVETGRKRPSPELARLCDAALGRRGALIALVPTTPRGGKPATSPPAQDAVALSPSPAAASDDRALPAAWAPPGRRQVLGAGAGSVLAAATPAAALPTPALADGSLLDVSTALFDQFRRVGQAAPPGAVLPALAEQTRTLRALAARTGPRTGRGLLTLCARYAEFAGWMAQEAGADATALRWTEYAVELGAESGDADLASYALVRQGLVAYYRGDAARTVALAQGARSDRLPYRIRGLAAQREAQGHALAGDDTACLRALDRARGLLARAEAEQDPAGPVLGTTHLRDPAAMTTGWCLLDLGRPSEAARVLDQEIERISAKAMRTQARYGARRALAHALAGEIDQACAHARELLSTAHTVASATIALDLRRLSRALDRHPRNPAVREVAPLLAFALSPTALAL
ncbi:helix-turn-helix domain-containing protein [Streptomyces sp. NPDC093085]|uniref:helix-turn-helix domain-containing protein n=1 Tax=Streptomyces sp. NPDC093085 TaxID=3155068 RepID=UPI00341BE401